MDETLQALGEDKLKEINSIFKESNENFYKTICNTGEDIYDKSNDIKRSFKGLLKSPDKKIEKTSQKVFTCEKKGDDTIIHVTVDAFTERYNKIFTSKQSNESEQNKKIAKKKCKKKNAQDTNSSEQKNNTYWHKSINELKNKINEYKLPENAFKDYFDLWEKEQWDLYDFYLTILKMDIALEYDKIGMIKFR